VLTVQLYGLDAALVNDASALQAELRKPAIAAYRTDVDMLGLMRAGGPPSYVQNGEADEPPSDPEFDLLHHPLHARALDARAEATQVTLEADIPALGVSSPASAIDFLLDHLKR
jgi:hypothetical protein